MFHDDKGPVPDTLHRLQAALEEHDIRYVVIGATAMGVHQFRRATEDVNLCMRAADLEKFRQQLVGKRYQSVEGRPRRFYDPETQVTFDILVADKLAGRTDKNKTVRFPDPDEAIILHGLPTVTLDRLIALKLVTWRHKDFADVISLIRANDLREDFADRLPEELRIVYVQCYDEMREEDRYDRMQSEE